MVSFHKSCIFEEFIILPIRNYSVCFDLLSRQPNKQTVGFLVVGYILYILYIVDVKVSFKHKNGATRYTHIKVCRNKNYFTSDPLNGDNKYTANEICKMIEFLWITYMLGLVDSFSDKWLAFLWEQTVPHYWLTCFSIPMKMSFWINSLRKAKESLPESSIYHTVISRTLSLLIIKDLRS